jgi:hypothetical protein
VTYFIQPDEARALREARARFRLCSWIVALGFAGALLVYVARLAELQARPVRSTQVAGWEWNMAIGGER